MGVFQEFPHTVDQCHPLPDTGAPLAGEVAPFPLSHRRHEARLQQAMLEECGQPSRIVDSSLASRHGLDRLGLDQHDLARALPQVDHRS